ncbi:patatin-like phospholipase family protein [Planotetraspora phitsanulokensis]|uniref:patatin-like phospholipase family protein n=1 Tax=Planotetraspora phitsanulokensis TaxID=575192 RepID=UPI0019500319|nr:patatin-like phospholipase family protein [Planotetraspora phitsanulokensis]
MTSALVLGGGGVAGIAWEAGVVVGLRERGVDLGTADRIIGTSAGSVTGTLLATGADLEAAVGRQANVDTGPAPTVASEAVMEAFAILFDPSLDPQEARRRVGQMALAAPTGPATARIERIGDRLPIKEWPDRELLITSVNAATGEFVVWDKESGVPLVLAVASSCAVPMVYPPVEISGGRYVDGGVRSPTNADLASGAGTVLVLEPLGAMSPRAMLEAELLAVGTAQTLVVQPDEATVAVFGDNVLDPGLWGPAYKAGLAQSETLAESVAAVWSA